MPLWPKRRHTTTIIARSTTALFITAATLWMVYDIKMVHDVKSCIGTPIWNQKAIHLSATTIFFLLRFISCAIARPCRLHRRPPHRHRYRRRHRRRRRRRRARTRSRSTSGMIRVGSTRSGGSSKPKTSASSITTHSSSRAPTTKIGTSSPMGTSWEAAR